VRCGFVPQQNPLKEPGYFSGITLGYGLDVRGVCGPNPACYSMGATGSFPGVKQPERKVEHSPPSRADVKECMELYLHFHNTPSWCSCHLKKHRDNFTFYKTLFSMQIFAHFYFGFHWNLWKISEDCATTITITTTISTTTTTTTTTTLGTVILCPLHSKYKIVLVLN